MRSRLTTIGLAAGLLLGGGSALAQGSPSADSIINSLRPGAGMTGGTRGIRPVGPSESTPVAPSPAIPAALPRAAIRPVPASPAARAPSGTAEPAATAQSGAPSVNLTVQFGNDSAQLTPQAMHTLDQLGTALTSPALANFRFRIEGHTDAVGNHDHNQVLSEQRAKAVVDYLADKFHVDRSRVEAVGMGPDQPLVPARAGLAEPRNRRVTVVNIGT